MAWNIVASGAVKSISTWEFLNKDNDLHEQEPENNEQYYAPPQPPIYAQQPILHQEKPDIFANLDKTGYIIIFVAFLLGFFMGKTMQPVILRPG